MNDLGGRAGRLASEFVIIVLGVLVALGVDAWNTDRVEAARGDMYLRRISEDLMEERDLLQRAIVEAEAPLALSDSLLRSLDRGGPRPGAASAAVVFALFGNRSCELPRSDGTFREMVGNAELSLIRDPRTRRAIVDYHATADRFTERIAETRALLRSPAYQHWGAAGILRNVGDSARVNVLLSDPSSVPYVSQLLTYQSHRRSLWQNWLEAVDEALAVMGPR